MIKQCTKCGESKQSTDFAFKNKAKGKLSPVCKNCQNDYTKQHYKLNQEKYILKAKTRNKRLRDDNYYLLLDYLSNHNCTDCGEDDIVVLEFDHLYDKKYNIAQMIRNTEWQNVLTEISKCDVVCANCHKKRTAKQFGWRKANFPL